MYEANSGTATTDLQKLNPTVFTNDTISKILSLTASDGSTVHIESVTSNGGQVTVASGTEVVLVTTSDLSQTTLTPPVNAPVVIFQGKGGVNTTINDGLVSEHAAGVVDRVVVGSSGNDRIVIGDAKNTHLTLGTGNSTVVAGAGEDTIVAGLGNSTIIGSTGHAIVELKGNASDYTVTVNNGHAVVSHVGDTLTTDISKIQFVQLDNGHSLTFANNQQQASVSLLYSAALGRDADAGGLDFYFEAAQKGLSLKQIAEAFMASPEYTTAAPTTDAQFVSNLYHNVFGRDGDASGMAFWTTNLANGVSRADILAAFVQLGGQNLDGTIHTEATVVGSVTVVHNIV